MTTGNYRIHPAIGIARVGNSEEYYLGPETMAGTGRTGGLPIKAGSDATTIQSSDLRDADGKFKRQAARFKIYRYPASAGQESYPMDLPADTIEEIKIGSKVGDRTVDDIIWTVHVANKKANTFVLIEEAVPKFNIYEGVCGFSPPDLPPIRNWVGPQPADKIAALNDAKRVKALTIDPGPRTISGKSTPPVAFDAKTQASYSDEQGKVVSLPDYPKSFPADAFPGAGALECPSGPIDTLGQLATDGAGRLLVLGGYGKACGWNPRPEPPLENLPNREPLPFQDDVNNEQWFDDASDGPVTAVIRFDDGSVETVAGAWVVTTDPSYAPQTLNVVSLFDDVYDAWVRRLGLVPEIHPGDDGLTCSSGAEKLPANWFGRFNAAYKPAFDEQLKPIFQSVALQKWTTNLNVVPGVSGHDAVGEIAAATNPAATQIQNLAFIRIPGNGGKDQDWDKFNPLMPASLGDANQSFMTLTPTQYFLLSQWAAPPSSPSAYSPPPLGPGEALDKAVLVNCLGGRFSPGIDLTFFVRLPELYVQDWRTSGTGPFRIKQKPLTYHCLPADGAPLLSQGYIPLNTGNTGAEPGDLSKMMAIPWHTDYNSCATHLPSPNPPGNQTEGQQYLFWSWPAQRPVAVYVASEVKDNGSLIKDGKPLQQWSIRGPNTSTMDSPAQDWGRFQRGHVEAMLTEWWKIGVVVNATAIDTPEDGAPLPGFFADFYLEVQSTLDPAKDGNPVEPFPNFLDQLPAKKPDGGS